MTINPLKNEFKFNDPILEESSKEFYASYEVIFNLLIDESYQTIVNLKVLDYFKPFVKNITWEQVYGPTVEFIKSNNDYTITFDNEEISSTKVFKVLFYLKNNTTYSLTINVFKEGSLMSGLQWDDGSYVLLDDNTFITLENDN